MIVPEVRYCGRQFSEGEIELIRRVIAEDPERTREKISKIVCKLLGWYKSDGGLKGMSCKVALLRMQQDGLIKLPPPRNRNGNGRVYGQYTLVTEPDNSIDVSVEALSDLSLKLVVNTKESYLWNEYIARYHYLGYNPLPGAQLRYFAVSPRQILGLMGFGASAWKVAPRDRFIGWSDEQRLKNLHLVVNNARFLILPWVKSKNLASKLLAMAAKGLPDDWHRRYKYRPVLMETFVEIQRFHGTCYKAANWIYVGQTKGRGKCDVYNTAKLPIKNIWLYPLNKSFRSILCS